MTESKLFRRWNSLQRKIQEQRSCLLTLEKHWPLTQAKLNTKSAIPQL